MRKLIQQTGIMTVLIASVLVFFPAISVAAEPDVYEEDNSYETANIIILNSDTPQPHNFHEKGDQDWVKFFGLEGEDYRITATNAGNADIIIDIYGTDGRTFLKRADSVLEGKDESLHTDALPEDGIYHVVLSNAAEISEGGTDYVLTAFKPSAPAAVPFEGSVRDAFSGNPLGDTMIRTTQSFTALANGEDGAFVMYHEPLPESDTFSLKADAVTLTARVPEFEIFRQIVFMLGNTFRMLSDSGSVLGTARNPDMRFVREDTVIQASSLVEWDATIELIPVMAGDISGDRKTDLADALIALKTAAGDTQAQIRPDYKNSGIDVNGDDKVGTAEAVHILRRISESEG